MNQRSNTTNVADTALSLWNETSKAIQVISETSAGTAVVLKTVSHSTGIDFISSVPLLAVVTLTVVVLYGVSLCYRFKNTDGRSRTRTPTGKTKNSIRKNRAVPVKRTKAAPAKRTRTINNFYVLVPEKMVTINGNNNNVNFGNWGKGNKLIGKGNKIIRL